MQRLSSGSQKPSGPGNAELPARPSGCHGSWWPTIYRLARAVLLTTVVAYVAHLLWRNWGELREHEFSLRWQPVALSYAVFGVYLVNRGLIWHWITRKFGCSIPLPQALAAWLYSQPGKYLPGKVFLLAGRLLFYQREGQSAFRVSMCFGVEVMCDVLGAVLVLLAALIFAPVPVVAGYRRPAIVLVLVLFVAANPRQLERLANLILRLARRPAIALSLQYRDVLALVVAYTLNWTLLGAGFLLYVNAVYPVPIHYLVYLAGSFALATTIGILAVFAPAGLGVREGVLMLALSAIMPQGMAAVVTLGARLWMSLGELVAVGAVALVTTFRRRFAISHGDSGHDAAPRAKR